MGCDIHGVFQKFDGGKWVDVPTKYEFGRHYLLFSVLADVRNEDGVTPISEPRWFPDGFEVGDNGYHPVPSLEIMPKWNREHHTPGDEMAVWMGQHSFSWLTAEEMLWWARKPRSAVQSGVISREERQVWDGVSTPKSYCQFVGGPGVVTVDDDNRNDRDDWTHVCVSWEADILEHLAYFFDEVKRLADEHGSVRFVFGFDS